MSTRFVVSTTHHLLAIDLEAGTLWRIHSGAGLYFGLAKGADGLLYAACRNSILGPDNYDVRAHEHGKILVFDPDFRLCDELQSPFPLRDVHGIACFADRIWVTCPFDNMVAIYDVTTGGWDRWYPAPDPADRDRDVHHFNTIGFSDGQIRLLAHHFGPSELLFYDYPSLQLVSAISLGAMAHDVLLFDGETAVCSSRDGWIVNRRGQRLRTGNFPRGVSTTSAGNLLGMSMHCPRDQRQLQNGILRWYSPDWKFQADYVLPGVGMILDIVDIGDRQFPEDALELWPHAETTRGGYNRCSPGNVYLPDSFASCGRSAEFEWHAPDGAHRWTAARESSLSIVINPGETRLWMEMSSAHPGPYSVEIRLNRHGLGTVEFAAPGVQWHEFLIPPDTTDCVLLSFIVPRLWKPSELIPGSEDPRLIGVAVHSVGIG